MPQGEGDSLLPWREMKLNRAPVTDDGFDKPEHIAGTDIPIETRPRVASGDDAVTSSMDQPVNDESLILPEYDDRAGPQL